MNNKDEDVIYKCFLSYIKKTITYEAIKQKKKINESNLYLYEEEKFLDTIESEDFEAQCIRHMDIDLIFQQLPVDHREILYDLFFLGLSVSEVAKRRNTSRQNINQIKKRIIAHLREEYKHE